MNNQANYRRRGEAKARWLLILDEIERIADAGLPFPAQKKIEDGVRKRSRIFPEKGMRWLVRYGHLRVLHRSSLGMQVEVVRSGKRTAGPDVLACRQVRRREKVARAKQIDVVTTALPDHHYEDDPAAVVGGPGEVAVIFCLRHDGPRTIAAAYVHG